MDVWVLGVIVFLVGAPMFDWWWRRREVERDRRRNR